MKTVTIAALMLAALFTSTPAQTSEEEWGPALGKALAAVAADVERKLATNTCSGILHKTEYGLRLGGGKGEGEGICIFPEHEAKVLSVCVIGKRCVITGRSDLCPGARGRGDDVECAKMLNVTKVRR